MKIIQITASYKPAYIYGGPIQSVSKLCEAIVAISDKRLAIGHHLFNAHELQVLTTTANGKTELEVTENPTLVDHVPVTYFKRLTKDHSHFSPQLLWRLKRILQTAKAQPIIHIHAWWNLVSVLSCFVAKWYNVPVLLSPRGMITDYTKNNRNSFAKKLIHNIIGKNLLKYCHIHTTSEQEKQDILKIITPKSISVIPNLINIKHSVSSSKLAVYNNPATFRLIFLSRIEEKKGLELLFDALSLLKINWQLTIAGSGKDKYLESLKIKAKNLNIHNQIDWFGQVSNEDKYTLMAQHDLLILTSFNENFANVVVEGLSVGTPVLISNQVGLSDYVIDQQFGWISNLNANDIKDMVFKAFSDHKRREMIRESAPEIIKRDFNDQVLANRYLQLYKSLI